MHFFRTCVYPFFVLIVAALSLSQPVRGQDQVASSFPPVIQGTAIAVAVDPSGNQYVTGYFSGSVDFNPKTGSDVKTSSGNSDAFVTRFNADGSYGWTQIFGGSDNDYAYAIAVSSTTVYVTGYFYSTNAGVAGLGTFASLGNEDIFVLALNASTGAPVSGFGTGGLQKFGGTGSDRGAGITVLGSNVYITGIQYSTTAGIGGAASLTRVGFTDAIVFALNATTGAPTAGFGTGGCVRFGVSGVYNYGYAIAGSGTTIYVTGNYNHPSAGDGDCFILALNAATGAAVSGFGSGGTQIFTGSRDESGQAIAISNGVVYVAGTFGSGDAGIGKIGTFSSTSNGGGLSNDTFVIALNAANGAAISGFGTGGIQKFGGTDQDYCSGVTVAGGNVFVTGNSASLDAGIGGLGSFRPLGEVSVFIAALNAGTGIAASGFGNNGILRFGGSQIEYGGGIAAFGNTVYTVGTSSSTNAGVNGLGGFDSTGFGGFLLPFDATTGKSLPLITSRLAAGAAVGQAFSYSLAATDSPTTFSSTNLPPGLSYSNGVISGTPTVAGTTRVALSATNNFGTGVATLALTVLNDAVASPNSPAVQGYVAAVALDSAGNRYITGTYGKTVDFNPGTGADIRSSFGNQDAFVTRYNADGSYAWTQTFGAESDYDTANAIAVSGTTVYVTGSFEGFAGGVGGSGTLQSVADSQDVFVLALNAGTGAPVQTFGKNGVQTFGGSGAEVASGICVGGSTVYVCGQFQSSDAGIGGAGTFSQAGPSYRNDGFIIALDATSGAAKSGFGTGGMQKIGGTLDDYARAVAYDSGNLYLAGSLGSADATVGGTTTLPAPTGYPDAFLMTLNPTTGAMLGYTHFGGTGSANANAVAVANGVIYVAGDFTGTDAQLNGLGNLYATAGGTNAFVLALSTSGGVVSTFGVGGVKIFGGTSYDEATGVAVANSTVYVGGYLSSADAGFGVVGTFANSGNGDAFALALDASSGVPVSGFGVGGILKFGGTQYDIASGIAAAGSTSYLCGSFYSTDAGVGGTGTITSTGFNGFLLPINPPKLTSPLSVSGMPGQPFVYTITGSNNPTVFSATGLPAGLSYSNGVISGTMPAVGAYSIPIAIQSPFGSDSGTLTITSLVDAVATVNPPVIQGGSNGVAVDAAGNRYVVGTVTGIVDFNPNVGMDIKGIGANAAAFVTRYNANGSYAWTQIFGGQGTAEGNAIAVVGTTIYAAGVFNSANAGIGGAGSLNGATNYSGFILALDSATGAAVSGFGTGGVQTFADTYQGLLSQGYEGISVSNALVANASTVYVSGSIATGSSTYIATVFAFNLVSGAPVAGFGTAGVQKFGGTNHAQAGGMAISGNVLYVAGYYKESAAELGCVVTISSGANGSAFILALNAATGTGISGFGSNGVQTYPGVLNTEGSAIAVSNGNLYVGGEFGANDSGFTYDYDCFVLELNATTGAVVPAFGTNGVYKFGGSNSDYVSSIATAGSNVYVCGSSESHAGSTYGFGGFSNLGYYYTSYVLALNAASGTLLNGFANNGALQFGGTAGATAQAIVFSGTTGYVAGSFSGADAGVGGLGGFDSTGFGGFLLPFDSTTGESFPRITSPLLVAGQAGAPFTYTITANGSPTSITASNLPAGLTVSNGVISGTLLKQRAIMQLH